MRAHPYSFMPPFQLLPSGLLLRNPHIIRHRVQAVDIAVAIVFQRGPIWPAVPLLRPEPDLVAVALEASGVMLGAPAEAVFRPHRLPAAGAFQVAIREGGGLEPGRGRPRGLRLAWLGNRRGDNGCD